MSKPQSRQSLINNLKQPIFYTAKVGLCHLPLWYNKEYIWPFPWHKASKTLEIFNRRAFVIHNNHLSFIYEFMLIRRLMVDPLGSFQWKLVTKNTKYNTGEWIQSCGQWFKEKCCIIKNLNGSPWPWDSITSPYWCSCKVDL